MTCGLCHREPDQHTLSTSGPTRCQYLTHRADCPATFTSKCSDHIIDGRAAPPESQVAPEMKVEEDKDAKIRELEAELKQLNLGPMSHTPSTAPQATLQANPQANPLATPQATPNQNASTTASGSFNVPLPPTPSADQAQAWGQAQSSLQDMEKMVRDHVATNQQHLNAQTQSNGSYAGPTMPQIRQVPDVQTQADLIMSSIKTACPVFGQNLPAGSVTVPGINTLSQGLQQAGLQQTVRVNQQAGQLLGHTGQLPGQPHGLQQHVGQTLGQQQPIGQLLGQQQAGHPAVQQRHAADPLGQQQLYGHQGTNQNLQQILGQASPNIQSLQTQQWAGLPQVQQHLQNTTQIPNLISTLAQLGPSALPVLQALQQQIPLTNNIQQVQQPMWTPTMGQQPQQGMTLGQGQHGFGHPNQYLQGQLLQQPGQLLQQQPLQQVQPGLGNLFGQATHQPAVQPQQGLLHLATQPPQQQRQATVQQGMSSSMTGVMFVRPTDFAKYCQVEYAKKAKSDNCNLVLYVWGYVAQMLASKQGLVDAMPEQEQLGRLQHLLHVLELCAMQCSSTDFNSPAWLCAKNYSDRVFQDLDSGSTSWAQIGPKMHPTNMMQAMSAHPKVSSFKQDKFGTKPTNNGQLEATPGPVCPKWVDCDIEDKCQYEVDNPGRTCNRPHYCTFCLKKFKQTRKHKEVDCRKKTELAGSSNGQPTS